MWEGASLPAGVAVVIAVLSGVCGCGDCCFVWSLRLW